MPSDEETRIAELEVENRRLVGLNEVMQTELERVQAELYMTERSGSTKTITIASEERESWIAEIQNLVTAVEEHIKIQPEQAEEEHRAIYRSTLWDACAVAKKAIRNAGEWTR